MLFFYFYSMSLDGYMVIIGFYIFLQFSNCYKRGNPNVTFLSEIPAKWKVFNVICVVG